MEQKTPNPKCTKCKCYWKPDDTDIKTSGLYFKTCKKCRENDKQRKEKNKCEHGKQKHQCVECMGSSICPHGKRKHVCVVCGGNGICHHGKKKHLCVTCEGSSICEHKREKRQCVECRGSCICPHGKRKHVCVVCGGNGLCHHGREKNKCGACGGSAICEHGKQKYLCVKCGGASICEHGKQKRGCKECNFKLYLVNLQRGQLRRLFNKTDVIKKTKPSIEYLGCSSEYFIEYIEKQFKDGMNWDNIHLDHIKPISKFNLDDEDEFLQCCNYKNFQPLLAKDNLEKHNKFTKEDEEEWIKRMEDLTI
jgi:hypothetical protein